jgi:hypothetical protein
MKKVLILLLILAHEPMFANSNKDGYCTCLYQVNGNTEKLFKISSTRPVICASCEERCSLQTNRLQAARNFNTMEYFDSKCAEASSDPTPDEGR